MIRTVILYPNTPDGKFDLDYYIKNHIDLVRSSFGDAVVRLSVHKGVSRPNGDPAPFLVSTVVDFRDVDSMTSGMQKHGEEIAKDVSNFTTITPIVQIEESII